MYKIIICEDNNIQRKKIKDFIEHLIVTHDYDFKIALCTGKVGEVLEFIENKDLHNEIYFLDIGLNTEINGIKLAEKIRKKDKYGHIIFITTHSELCLMVFKYKIGAIDFILKDNVKNIKQRINECLEYINSIYISQISEDFLTIKQPDRIINIAMKNILFIEASSIAHKIIIHESNKYIELYGSLNSISKKLNESFYRCHRSVIVNKKEIIEIDKKSRTIIMSNGEKCYASFRYIGGLL